MATLVRSRILSPPTSLDSSIPTPFPREQLPQTLVETSNGGGSAKAVNPFEVQETEQRGENNEAGPLVLAESGIATPTTYTLVRDLIIFLFYSFF
jgi:hypothetical protein